MGNHGEELRKLNHMGKAHFGKEWTHGRVMTDVDISKGLAFEFGPGSVGCDVCQRLFYAAQHVCTDAEMEQLTFRVRHPEAKRPDIEP